MKIIHYLLGIALIATLFSCSKLESVLPKSNAVLSDSTIAAGLKEALRVGTDTAVKVVSKSDGYFKDQVIKIMLPPEAQVLMQYKDDSRFAALGLSSLIDNVILSMNRAAEDAAKQAAPIFVNAITSMTITDAVTILKGNDSAATHYLRGSTFTGLFTLFNPIMKTSLDKPLVGGVSANSSWNTLTSTYNNFVTTFPGSMLGYNAIPTQLDVYATNKGLNGLFYKVALQEAQIRKDPIARVNDLLKSVFSSLDK